MASLSLIIDGRPAKVGAREFKQAVDSIKREGREATKSTDKVERGFKKVQDRSAGLKRAVAGVFAGLSAALVARQITQVVSGYELVLATVKGVTGATEEQFARLQATARDLGATTRFSAKEAGEGLLFLARAGFTTEQAIAAVPATLNLAAAGMVELGEAADWASNILSQFKLAASETARVADTLIKTANSSNTDIRQLAEAMKFAGPVAGALRISVEKTAAALGVLGDSGIQASLAGTNLRGILAGLLGPTTAGEKAIHRLGLSLQDVDPATQDLVDIFRRFRDAGLDAAASVDIFGRRNFGAALILADGVEKVDALTKANEAAAGEAERLAKVMNDTLSGSFKNLRSAIEEAAHQFGESGFAGAMRSVIDTTTEAIRLLLGLGDSSKTASHAAFVLARALKALGAAVAALLTLKLILALLNPITAAIVGLSAVVGGLTYAWADATAEADKHQIAVEGLQKEYTRLKDTLKDLTDIQRGYASAAAAEDARGRQEALIARRGVLQEQLDELNRLRDRRGARAVSPIDLNSLQQLALEQDQIAGPTILQQVTDILGGNGDALVPIGLAIKTLEREIYLATQTIDANAKSLGNMKGLTDDQRQSLLAYRDAEEEAASATEERNSILSRFIEISLQAAQLQAAENQRAGAVAEFVGELRTQLEIEQALGEQREYLVALSQVGVAVTESEADAIRELVSRLYELRKTREDEAKYRAQQKADQAELNRKYQDEQRRRQAAIDDTLRQIDAFADQLGQAFADAFNRAILEGQGFKDSFRALLKDLQSIIVQELTRSLIAKPLAAAFQQALGGILGGGGVASGGGQGGLFGIFSQLFGGGGGVPSAMGNAFQGGNVIPFARGGVVDMPGLFPLAGGRMGLYGEAGPEAILPLRRGANGRLGVETSGNGSPSPVVHMTVVTQDAASFQRSGRQITNQLRRALNRRPA